MQGLGFIVLIMLSGLALAEPLSPQAIFPPDQRVVLEGTRQITNHPLVLSTIKKVNGKWRATKTELVTGRLFEQTIELELQDTQALKNDLQRFAESNNLSPVFSCAGLECGRSHAWANEVFKNRLLYGVAASQVYMVWQQAAVWYTAYIVERGNQHVYVQWQVLTSDDASPKKTTESDTSKAFFIVKQTELTHAERAALAEWLAQTNGNSFAVVGHNRQANLLFSEQQSTALKSAAVLTKTLTDLYPNMKFSPYGLGSLAPRLDVNADVHLEIVPINN